MGCGDLLAFRRMDCGDLWVFHRRVGYGEIVDLFGRRNRWVLLVLSLMVWSAPNDKANIVDSVVAVGEAVEFPVDIMIALASAAS